MNLNISTWENFKAIKAQLKENDINFEVYEDKECNDFFHLVMVSNICFVYSVQKGEPEADDYLSNFRSKVIRCNYVS